MTDAYSIGAFASKQQYDKEKAFQDWLNRGVKPQPKPKKIIPIPKPISCEKKPRKKAAHRGRQKKTTEQYISEAYAKHDGLYSYANTIYHGASKKLVVTCKRHGDFEIRANAHLEGQGCRNCSHNRLLTTEIFVKKATARHKGRYLYTNTEVRTAREKVLITCRKHGDFRQQATAHLMGQGCPECRADGSKLLGGFKKDRFIRVCGINNNGFGTLYLIKCFGSGEVFYKVGITSKTVGERFCNNQTMPYDYDVLYEVLDTADYIYNLEQRLHSLLSKHLYEPNIEFGGSVKECFTTIKPIEKLIKELQNTEQLQLLA